MKKGDDEMKKGSKIQKWSTPRYLFTLKYPVLSRNCFECNGVSLEWKSVGILKIGTINHRKVLSPIDLYYERLLLDLGKNSLLQRDMLVNNWKKQEIIYKK